MVQDLHTPFLLFLEDDRQYFEAQIKEHGFPAIVSARLDTSHIEGLLSAPQTEWGSLGYIVASSIPLATVYETLGYHEKALALCRLGVYEWPHPWPRYPEDQDDFKGRMNCQSPQLKAGICADRIGTKERARELYTWAAANYTLTPDDIDRHSSSGEYQVIWERYPYRAYALACLERWEEALEVARETQNLVDQDRRAQTSEAHRVEFRLLRVVTELASYKMNPGNENRRKAQEMLHPQAVTSFDHGEHRDGLFYLYNLRARHPELANPPEAETPQAERALQGAQACKQIMAGFGISLDDTVDSLKVLDSLIRDLYLIAQNSEDKKKQLLFMWGSYFGEVVSSELAGGQWRISQENLLDSTVTWEIGGAELHLWAFKVVFGYITGQWDKSLHQTWLEAEEEYVEYTMAARYS